MSETIHVRPTAELAERVLMPGDPGRALAMAQHLLVDPRMFNHHRGLWGYTGKSSRDGQLLTIQSTGMGGPSAAIVLHELILLGARRVIRVGTCGAITPGLALGDHVLACEALAKDGTSAALDVAERVQPDGALLGSLRRAAGSPAIPAPAATPDRISLDGRTLHEGTIVSTDLFYDPRGSARERAWRDAGAIAVEMEAATIFAIAALQGIAAACLLVVSDVIGPAGRTRIEDARLREAVEAMGSLATSALAG